MQENISTLNLVQVQNDSAAMLISGIALVILLIIVLIIVVSAMRVKTHKDRFCEVLTDNKKKAENLVSLGQEVQDLKVKDTKSEQELVDFAETKDTLNEAKTAYVSLQKRASKINKELQKTKISLEDAKDELENIRREYKILKDNHGAAQEDNVKYRTNNVRLLMKLDKL
jgi:predicted  nucleic acid-binding Zn-ribbon protein